MRTTRELGRFLQTSKLRLRVGLTKAGFLVELLRRDEVVAQGKADTFPDAVDEAVGRLARISKRGAA